MGFTEIAYRVLQLLYQKAEAGLLATGWRPSVTTSGDGDKPIFTTCEKDIASRWHDQFEWNPEKLDKLAHGRIDLFSHKDLDLGNSIDWLTEPVNGVKSPCSYGKQINYRKQQQVGDIKIIWELGRQQHLVPLAIGYLLSGKAIYKETIRTHISSWADMCPFGYTVHWCSSLEVALRIISWSIVHGLLILSGEKRGLFSLVADEKRMRDIIYQHAWFIRHHLSLYSSANNHLIGELTGLWTVCSVFDLGPRGRKWAEFASRFLEEEAEKQVHPDGVDKEQAIYYHCWVLEYFMFADLVSIQVGHQFTERFRCTIDNMACFLKALMPGDGVPPQIGDADDGFVVRYSITGDDDPFRDLLSSYDIINKGAERITEKSFWYALLAGKGSAAIPTENNEKTDCPPYHFGDGGYAVLGDDTVRIVFDAGPLGYTGIAAHGHADALSVCMAVEGDWWLVDPGTYTYHDNPEWRNYFRSTAAHNTVVVDDADQSKIGGDFLWLRHANARFLCQSTDTELQSATGTHDGYGRFGVIHERQVEYHLTARRLVVTDRFKGAGTHDLCWYWHLHPDIYSELDQGSGSWVLVHRKKDAKVTVSTERDVHPEIIKGALNPILGWYSPKLGSKAPAEVLVYRTRMKLPCEVTSSFTVE